MKRKHGFWVLCLVVLGIGLLGSVISSAGGVATGTDPLVNYDEWNDSYGAPDLRSVSMSDAGGIVSVTVYAAGLDGAAEGDLAVATVDTMLDVDRSTATGDEYGSDYALEVGRDADGLFTGVWQYADGEWVEVLPTEAMTFTAGTNEYTFTFATSELGGASGFDYYLTAGAWSDGELLAADYAPEDGSWTYWPLTTELWNGGGAIAALPDGSLYLGGDDSAWHRIDPVTLHALGLDDTPITTYGSLPGAAGDPVTPISVATPMPTPTPVTQVTAPLVKPVIAKPVTFPAKPTAGKTFRLTFAVTRSDTGGKLLDGKMICDPSVKGTVIKHFELFKDGTASMRFTIPKAYHGKVMKVHLTIEAGGQSATRNVMFHVG